MDPTNSAQDILRCDLCQTTTLQSHCGLCQINLCKACIGDHLSNSSKRHNVVPYKHRTSTPNYPKCPNHTQKHCELYCDECDIPVCSTCLFSGEHIGHDLFDVLQKLSSKQKNLETELKELEKRIYPIYEEMALDINSEKINIENHCEKLAKAVTKQGEDWHREINIIVNKQKSEIDGMKSKHMAALNKQENEIKQIISHVKHCIVDLKEIIDTNDVTLIFVYKSRNVEFKNVPPKVKVSLPSFTPHQINKEELHQMFGSLSAFFSTTEQDNTMKTPDDVSCPQVEPLFHEPELITTIKTGYGLLDSVTCLSNEEIWTCGYDNIMKLFNFQGKLLKSKRTKSGKNPNDIAVTRSGDLVYTDPVTRTVNIVKDDQIQEVIRLHGWKPCHVCSTSSDDLLVIVNSDDYKQSKVVRYSGSTEKQTIQFDSEGKSLYSSSVFFKYISENRNMDICVADYTAQAIVVVNQTGKLRFRYTGHPSLNKRPLNPAGITTDSQSQILTADCDNNCIHILDQNGHFLHYIRYVDNCDLQRPWGLCVDTRDNLFVAECRSGKLKKIQYI